ncbi:hypothetical protein GCM10010309_29110 [Streptomyces violaceochromogenes]|nr:hypothetical protein GCM10010309_29110 [Streptomyces violaceochromogenes]
MVRDVGSGRFVGGAGCGDVEEGLAGDAQVLALRVEFTQPAGEVLNAGADLSSLLVEFGLTGLDVPQDGPDLQVVAHTVLQEAMVDPVRRRAMTEVIAQNTQERELAGRCS